MDIFVPRGCDVNIYKGEVLAPVSGRFQLYPDGTGYHLFLPKGVYITGTEKALEFAGIKDPKLSLIDEIWMNFGHLKASLNVPIDVVKGESIGDIVPFAQDQQKLGYQISIRYAGIEYMFSPTLFIQDGPKWICVVG